MLLKQPTTPHKRATLTIKNCSAQISIVQGFKKLMQSYNDPLLLWRELFKKRYLDLILDYTLRIVARILKSLYLSFQFFIVNRLKNLILHRKKNEIQFHSWERKFICSPSVLPSITEIIWEIRSRLLNHYLTWCTFSLKNTFDVYVRFISLFITNNQLDICTSLADFIALLHFISATYPHYLDSSRSCLLVLFQKGRMNTVISCVHAYLMLFSV